MKTKVLFCFDSEDYTSPCSTDMLPLLAQLLEKHGIAGNFMMVGLLAESVQREGRRDVTEALRSHVIGFHTYGHTLHPDVAEATDVEDYGEAQRRLDEEARAVETVKSVFGRDRLWAAVPPGNSVSYAAMYR